MTSNFLESNNSDLLMLALYVFLALAFSFLCSVAEAVLLSITPSYIEDTKKKKPRLGNILKRLKEDNIDRSLAAILSLNTIAHTVGAIAAGAKAEHIFGSAWFGVFSAIMTLLILFLSEIIPKTVGALYWKNLVYPVAVFVDAIIVLLYPLVWASEFLTKLISGGNNSQTFNKDELVALARIGEKSGAINGHESRIIKGLFNFSEMKASEVMTPRTVVFTLPENLAIQEAINQIQNSPFSRIPVYTDDIDNIHGFVLKDEVLKAYGAEKCELLLSEMKREIMIVPESISLPLLLERFLQEKQSIALMVNEYGGTEGLISMEDLVETLLDAEIIDEADRVVDMQAFARKKWKDRYRKLVKSED